MPSPVARNSVIAPPVSAQKPCIGESLVIFEPMVWTIRQPPNGVPRPMGISDWNHESIVSLRPSLRYVT